MKCFFLTILCFSTLFLFSQKNLDLRLAVHNVYIAPNYSKLPPMKPGFMGEISLGKKLNGEKYWHSDYNFPNFYLSVFAGYPGSEEFGYVVSLCPQLSFENLLFEKLNYHVKTGFGIAYMTNPYNREYNPKNKLVGSSIIEMANVEIGLSYEFLENNYLGASLGVIHFSNGHTKLPNIGMNLPEVNVFYKHSLNQEPKIIDFSYRDSIVEKWDLFISFGLGMHEYGSSTKPTNGPNYKISEISFGLTKKVNNIHKYRFGVNLLHYDSFEKFMIYQELNFGDPFLSSSVVGVFGAHEFMFGNFAFYTELGLDIYKPFYRKMIKFYGDEFTIKNAIKSVNSNKLGVRYYFIKSSKFGVLAGINLKVNMAQADFVEIFCSFEF